MSELRSNSLKVKNVTVDIGKLFHMKENMFIDLKESEKFQNDLYKKCQNFSEEFIKELKKEEEFSNILKENDVEIFAPENKELRGKFQKCMDKFIKNIGNKND